MYFGTDDHRLLALDTRTGTKRWEAHTDETGGMLGGRNALVVGSLVILPDYSLYAFDRATGERRWKHRPPSGDTPGRFLIATDGVRIFSGSPYGFVSAVDAATGKSAWSVRLASDNISAVYSPMVDRGTVFVHLRHFTNPSTGGIVALNAATGAIRWRRTFVPPEPRLGSGGSAGRVGLWRDLVISAADDGTVYGLNRDTGAIVWISPRPPEQQGTNDERPIVVVGDVAVVGSDLTRLTGLDAATGVEKWRLPSIYGSVFYELGADESYAYVVYVGLQLSAIEAATGKVVWTNGTAQSTDFRPFPVSDGQSIYVPGPRSSFALRR